MLKPKLKYGTWGLLLAVADQIESDPLRHDQGDWGTYYPCGSAYCIYGWGYVLLGMRTIKRDDCPSDWLNEAEEKYGWARELFPVDSALSGGEWRPRKGLTVPEALRALAAGATLAEVSRPEKF